MRITSFISVVCGLALIVGCTETDVSRPRLSLVAIQESQVVYNTLRYTGVSEDAAGIRKISFELTNPRDNPICITKNARIGYFGKIDYYNSQGQSYRRNTPTVPGLLAELDALTSEPLMHFIVVPPGGSLQIVRDIFPEMFPHANVVFAGIGPFYAQLKVDAVFECTPEGVSEGLEAYYRSYAMQNGNFVFLSGKAGPFYLQ